MEKVGYIIKKWWFYPLLMGVILRLIIIPVTFHPDLWGHSSVAYFFAHKGVLNIYEYLANLPSTHPLVKGMGIGDIFIYPPLTYFTLGIFRILARPFENPNFLIMIWNGVADALKFPMLHWHLFLYKLPYLFVDIAGAFIFAKLFNDDKKRTAIVLWLFNPLAIYSTFMMGQIDILPVFFTILSLYFFQRKKYRLSLICLGIGGSYKMYPLLLILPYAFVIGKNFKERVGFIFWGVLPYVVTILPYLPSPAFRGMVLFSPKSTKMLFMGWNVSGAEVIFPFLIILTFIYLHSYYSKTKLSIYSYSLLILLLIFSVTHYHPQWFLWLTPFLLWFLITDNFKYSILVGLMFLSWFFITLFFEPSLSYGLFSPIFPGLSNSPGMSDILSKYINAFQFKSMVRSVFAGASLFISYRIFKENI